MLNFYCPFCREPLKDSGNSYQCSNCPYLLRNEDGVWIDSSINQATQDKDFYEAVYQQEKGAHWLQGLNRGNWLKRVLERISLSYRRERFFRRYLKGGNLKILDLACGAGRDYFKGYGEITGVDLIKGPLVIAKQYYDVLVQSDIKTLPFADNYFDYVVSSDIFGHVRAEDKDAIIKEILRVLKPGGKTLHVIETDSTNIWFKIARCRPDLFKKYFVEQIGGHIGLELPSLCVARWQQNGFVLKKVIKIWGLIWPVNDYITLFDNEYRQISSLVNSVVATAKLVAKHKIIKLAVNVILNPINSLVEFFKPLDNGQGIMIVCQKKRS